MKTAVALFALIGALSGCALFAPRPSYRDRLQVYKGESVNQVLSDFGAPQNSYESGGKKYLTYLESRGQIVYDTGFNAESHNKSCKTTFVVSNDLVEDVSYSGLGCR